MYANFQILLTWRRQYVGNGNKHRVFHRENTNLSSPGRARVGSVCGRTHAIKLHEDKALHYELYTLFG
jgi:hypothetical protein